MRELESIAWPVADLGNAMMALARRTGVLPRTAAAAVSNAFLRGADLGGWLEWEAKRLGFEAEPLESTLRDLDSDLASAHPALLRVSDSLIIAVLGGDQRTLRVLTPALTVRRVSTRKVCEVIREPAERPARGEFEQLLREAGIPSSRQPKTLHSLLADQIGDKRFDQCWILRGSPAATPVRWLRQAGAVQNGAALIAAHTGQYLLWLASWAILGRLSFEGRMDEGWLLAWALLLLTLIPFRVATTWLQGLLAIGVGGVLKRRLLLGAMRLGPEEMRHGGIGTFLGQVLEAEAVESLALSGGIAGLLAMIELAVSAFVLGRFAILLAAWFGLTVVLALSFLRKYQIWTRTRMDMTQDLVECMVGHRTRLAQQRKEQWHEAEDQALENYLATSHSVDRTGSFLIAAVPRGWLFAGLACLAPAIIAGHTVDTEIAVALGGVLLAFSAFRRLTGSFADIAAAWVAGERILPLFRAAARPESAGELPAPSPGDEPSQKVIEADRLTYKYRKDGNPAVQAGSLTIRRGERILLEGPSGGGKTTFASLLSGMRQPDSGLLLINGLDRHTMGSARWRHSIAAAPQFHENHILTETLAFNLLMGRRWPPTPKDLEDAESICRDLGLGDLLDRMPSGILQMVGEGGWQLSHGERSRIYIARALLQSADLVILDESFAALDPENLKISMDCTLERAGTLMVIAHP